MKTLIRKYRSHPDFEQVVSIIKSEGEEWKDYLKPEYKMALESSITFVAMQNDTICGYCRAITDNGIYIWLVDLLVHKDSRGQEIGKQLMERVIDEFPGLEVYVLSDADPYYEKLGYKNEGTIFRVKK